MSTDTRMTTREITGALVRGAIFIGREPKRIDVPAGSTVTVLPHPVPGYVSLVGEDGYGDAFLFVIRAEDLDDVAPIVPVHVPEGKFIGSVWSDYGHRFIGGDDETDDDGHTLGYYVSCLTCGAHYVERPTADGGWNENDVTIIRGEYVNTAGEPAAECTGDTRMVHTIDDRRALCDYYREGNGEDIPDDHDENGCEHCEHECPCVSCGG